MLRPDGKLTKPRKNHREKNRNMAKATVVTPHPMSVIGIGSAREKAIGTATTTHPKKAMSNVISRDVFVFVA
jgi:hypothetical protein